MAVAGARHAHELLVRWGTRWHCPVKMHEMWSGLHGVNSHKGLFGRGGGIEDAWYERRRRV